MMSETTTISAITAAPPDAWGRNGKERTPKTEDLLATINRQLPFCDESERGVISCILQDPRNRLDEARNQLPDDAFYHLPAATVFTTLCEMADKGHSIDTLTLTSYLRDKGLLERVGGSAAVMELYTFAPPDSFFASYIGTLKEKRIARLGISLGATFVHRFQTCMSDQVSTVLDEFQGAVLGLTLDRDERGPEPIATATNEVLIRTETAVQAIKDGHEITGAQLGYSADVDRIWNGVERGDRIGICAHPSTGKTTILLNAALHLAQQGVPCLLFGLDDEAVSLARRTIADMADVDITEIRSGIGMLWQEGERKFKRMRDAQRQTEKLPIWIDDRTGLSIQQIAATTRRWFKKHARKPANSVEISCMIGIDYWQNVQAHIKGDENNDVKRLTATSLAWKNLIKSLGTAAGIMLSQLNRDVKETGRPNAHNNKGSSALFEDCTKMALLSNERRTLEELCEEKSGEEAISLKDKRAARVQPLRLGERLVVHDIVKNKDGPTGPVWLRLFGSRTRFSSLVPGKPIFSASYNKEQRQREKQEQVDALSEQLNGGDEDQQEDFES